MKRLIALVGLGLVLWASVAQAANVNRNKEDDSALVAASKSLNKEFASLVPKDKIKTVDDLHKKWEEVMAGTSKAILLDVRTHSEFEAFHIEGTSNINAGNFALIPHKIKDPHTEVWVFCRNDHRAKFVAGVLCRMGYKRVYLVSKTPDGGEGGLSGWIKRGHPVVNYYFGYADKNGIHLSPPPLKERNCGNYIREFESYNGDSCGRNDLAPSRP